MGLSMKHLSGAIRSRILGKILEWLHIGFSKGFQIKVVFKTCLTAINGQLKVWVPGFRAQGLRLQVKIFATGPAASGMSFQLIPRGGLFASRFMPSANRLMGLA